MKGSTENPKVFISYSWTSPQHEQWVLELAERLSGDGIVVILDKWDLKEGQDKHVFMEQMVNDETIGKVLVICDRGYQSKADNRKSGVGTETQLISKEVYENTGQEKFIPIVREYDESGKPCIPHYMASRIYIDLSSDVVFEENYQKLIRNLYSKPLLKKPSLGAPPSYITEEEQIILKTSHKVAEIRNALLNDRQSASGLIGDYLNVFLSSLEDFRIQGGSAPDFDDKVVESIEKMTPLRDDFIDFVSTIFKYQNNVDLENLHAFFERLVSFNYRPENISTYTRIDFDNYRFFSYELTLYFIAILINLKKYDEAAYFINSQYFYHADTGQLVHNGIEVLNHYATSLEEIRNKRLELRRVSVTADLIKSRANRKDIAFKDIVQADLILFYLTELHGGQFSWFPRTSAFNAFGSGIELFDRLVSVQHFEKIHKLFDVKNIDELKGMVMKYVEENKERRSRARSWDYEIRPLESVINPENIGTVK